MTDLATIINHLTLEQAKSILRTIAADNQTIAEQVIEIALGQQISEKWEDVAYGLVDELEQLEVEEVWERAGPSSDGYVDTAEAAEEMIEEVLTDYMAEMKRYQALSMNHEASELCKGLTAGLLRFERHATTEFKDWAGDSPQAFAESVVNAWRKGSPSDSEWQDFLQFNQDELSNWLAYSIRSKI